MSQPHKSSLIVKHIHSLLLFETQVFIKQIKKIIYVIVRYSYRNQIQLKSSLKRVITTTNVIVKTLQKFNKKLLVTILGEIQILFVTFIERLLSQAWAMKNL